MMPVLATGATQKEYSSEVGPQNDSKIESKMDQKVIQKENISNIMKTNFLLLFTTL